MIPYRSIHFVGVLTPEMASLAMYVVKSDVKVTASDDHSDQLYQPELEKAGITFYDMFAQTNVSRTAELLVYSRYYDARHQEVATAQKLGIPVMGESEFAKRISEGAHRVAILGEYDAPIIATWLEHVWRQGHQPVRALMQTVPVHESGQVLAVPGEHDTFVLPFSGFKRESGVYEADFLAYEASTVVIPSITYNYPELYMTLDDVYQAYYTFAKRVPRRGLIVGNGDYSRMKRLQIHLADRHIETYGFDRDVRWQIRDVETTLEGTSFSLVRDRTVYGPFTIPYVGEMYVYAATAVSVICLLHEMRPEVLQRGLMTVPKLQRYLVEKPGKEGRLLLDDRADHPDAIRHVFEYVRRQYPGKRIWCLYQPGSFLRTKALQGEFEKALQLADFVYIADIKGYPKEKSEGLHSRHLVASLKQSHPQTYYIESPEEMTALLAERVPSTDCIVTIGADGVCQRIVAPLIDESASEQAAAAPRSVTEAGSAQ